MENYQYFEHDEDSDKKETPKSFYKCRFISFDLQTYYVHLKYRLEESTAFESMHDDDERKMNDTSLQMDMFDIRKMTNTLDFGDIKRLINNELMNCWNSERKDFADYSYIEADLQGSRTPSPAQEIVTGYNVEKSLYFRSKHSRLDNYQRDFLCKQIQDKNADISQISGVFRVSKGVLYNLKKMKKYSSSSNVNLLKDNTKLIEKDRLDSLIDHIVRRSTIPVKINDIWQQLQREHNIRAPIHKVSSILKWDLNCSYK